MGSGLLKCFDDGITNNIDPGKPESRSMYEAQAAGKIVKKLPMSLGEALNRLAEDEVIKSAMPDEMYKVFHWYKNDEWEKFLGAPKNFSHSSFLYQWKTLYISSGIADFITSSSAKRFKASPRLIGSFLTIFPAA